MSTNIYKSFVRCSPHYFCRNTRVQSRVHTADWLRGERERAGWTAAQLAGEIKKVAAALGDPITLSQQAISHFETGKAKSLPRWIKFAETAFRLGSGHDNSEREQAIALAVSLLNDHGIELSDIVAREASAPLLAQPVSVKLDVVLPSEAALTVMFEGLLEAAGEDVPLPERAARLAQYLPVGLARIAGPQIGPDQALVPSPAATKRSPAGASRKHQQSLRT